jgi:hypothetical protein
MGSKKFFLQTSSLSCLIASDSAFERYHFLVFADSLFEWSLEHANAEFFLFQSPPKRLAKPAALRAYASRVNRCDGYVSHNITLIGTTSATWPRCA